MTHHHEYPIDMAELGGLGLLIALLGPANWLNTGARAVPGLVELLRTDGAHALVLAV